MIKNNNNNLNKYQNLNRIENSPSYPKKKLKNLSKN